jgi:hypothetical protein
MGDSFPRRIEEVLHLHLRGVVSSKRSGIKEDEAELMCWACPHYGLLPPPIIPAGGMTHCRQDESSVVGGTTGGEGGAMGGSTDFKFFLSGCSIASMLPADELRGQAHPAPHPHGQRGAEGGEGCVVG